MLAIGKARKTMVLIVVLCIAPAVAIAKAQSTQLPEHTLISTVRIGSTEDVETALSVVSLLAVAPDGRIAVAQPVPKSVWIFSPTGERLAEIGRDGEGPGEFRSLSMIGWQGDTMWVADGRLYRVTFFPPKGADPVIIGGASRRTERFARVPLPAAGGQWLTVRQTISDPRERSYRQELFVWNPDWEPVRSLALLGDGPGRLSITLRNNAVTSIADPFAANPIFAVSPDISNVTIVRRDGALDPVSHGRYSVTRISLGGDTLFHNDWRVHLEPLSRETRDAIVEEYVSSPDLQRITPSLAALRDAIEQSLRFPEFHLPVTKVVAGTDGSTWLRGADTRSGTVRWLVLDAKGKPARTVITDRELGMTVGGALSVLVADGNGLWAVEHDELDVPYVVRYELRPRVPRSWP